jgi:hypothetical protein
MLFASIVTVVLGVPAERRSLEELAESSDQRDQRQR